MMRADTSFHADEAGRYVRKTLPNLAARQLLAQDDRTAAVEAKIAVMHNTAQNSPGGRVFFGLRRKHPRSVAISLLLLAALSLSSLVTNAKKDGRFGPRTERKNRAQL
jgi:hypothetical protein